MAGRLSLHKRATFGLLSCLLVLLMGCSGKREAIHFSGPAQGTTYSITLVPGERPVDARALQEKVEARLAQIGQARAHSRADSEGAAVHRGPAGEWVEVDGDLYEVLMQSMEMSWLSNGAFDTTVGSLVRLWGFGGGQARSEPPTDEEIEVARARAGFQYLEL